MDSCCVALKPNTHLGNASGFCNGDPGFLGESVRGSSNHRLWANQLRTDKRKVKPGAILAVLTSNDTEAVSQTLQMPMFRRRVDPKNVASIILGGGAGTQLFPLTKRSATPAVPVGGCYRLIDIPMSNCINSNINKIFVLTQFNSASLNRHIARTYFGNGINFGDRFVEVLAATQTQGEAGMNWFQGTADAVRQFTWVFEDAKNRDGEFPTWLEYSIAKDAAYCLCCYLFKPNTGEQAGGDCFISKGFSNWKKKERLQGHVGGWNSAHNQAWRTYDGLLKQNQARREYKTLLGLSIVCMRFLLHQGLIYCGDDDEYEGSNNEGVFLGLWNFQCGRHEELKAITLRNPPLSLKLTSPDTQKDIITAFSMEIINAIAKDIGDSYFSILIDELHEKSPMNQLAIVIRFVDKGHVIERFLGIVQATDNTAVSRKVAIDDFFSTHGLSMSKLRGQGYGGTSNMLGELNSLKTLIMKENEYAYYVHCFAHDLHSTLIGVAKDHFEIFGLFTSVANLVNIVGAFVECRDTLQKKHGALVSEALNTSDLLSGQGLNEGSSKFKNLTSVLTMFSSVIDVLEVIADFGSKTEQKCKAEVLLGSLWSFDCIFSLHMMINVLGITDALSQALQKKDQDIVNAINLVRRCKEELKMMKESGWDSLLNQVFSFCDKHQIKVPNMNDMFQTIGIKKPPVVTNMHHYRVDVYCNVIDMQLQELNIRFAELNTELLLCVACLNPSDSFSAFDKKKLTRLAQYYPNDFSALDLMILEDQLKMYIMDLRSSIEFSGLNGIADLAQKMVETEKDSVYPLVYLLLTLALILPVATPTVERVFCATRIVKNRLLNQMEDQRTDDSWIAYIEKDILDSVEHEIVMQRFQNMKTCPWKISL